MKAKRAASIPKSAVDPSNPWRLPRLKSEFPSHPYKMTVAEWNHLLSRAKQGDAEAQWEVADRYFEGCKDESGRTLVNQSSRRGREWLQRAAEGGVAAAQNNIGVLVGDGEGFDKAPRKALVWLKRAFRGGNSSAPNNIAITYREVGDFKRAVFWFRKSVFLGDDGARIQLGIHYYWGIGVRRNTAAAIAQFRRAIRGKNLCEADREDAFFYLGLAYLEGKGVKASVQTARRFLKRANVGRDHLAASRVLSAL
jgi:TPR repeat protein